MNCVPRGPFYLLTAADLRWSSGVLQGLPGRKALQLKDEAQRFPQDVSIWLSSGFLAFKSIYAHLEPIQYFLFREYRCGTRSFEWAQVASILVLVLISASIATIVQTILALPAYATVQSAAKTGGRFLGTELLTSAWIGFFAGCLHTLSGTDHVAALAPLSIGRTRLESVVVRALWGCGPDAGQVIFGLLFLLLKDRLHSKVICTWGTGVVGITLLAIGAMGIREASEMPTPCVALETGECDVSLMAHLDAAPSRKKKLGFATFAAGIVHGILTALALPSRPAGAAFLGMFLVGTVLAMGSYTVFIGSCGQLLKDRVPRITEKLTWAASLVAISTGVALFVSQLFGFSLY